MKNSSLPDQIKHLGTPRIIAIISLDLVLLVLIFFLEYTYGTKHSDLVRSIMYTIPFPDFLTLSLLWLTTSSNEMQKIHVPWHRQRRVASGLLFLSLSILSLTTLLNSFMNNNLPDALGYILIGVSFLLMLAVILRFIMIGLQRPV